MKVITFQELEASFEHILEDIEANKEHYRIQRDDGEDVMLVPVETYTVLKDVYTDWVEEPQNEPPVEQFDPYPLPMEYIADAEPEAF
jgi:hypothetical protein